MAGAGPDAQSSIINTQHSQDSGGRASEVHQMALRSLWDVLPEASHGLDLCLKKRGGWVGMTVPPRDQTVKGADQKHCISHQNPWSVDFSSLQNARKNLSLVKSLNLNLNGRIPAMAQRNQPDKEPPMKESVRNS